MKRFLLASLITISALAAAGQATLNVLHGIQATAAGVDGTVFFANYAGPVDAPVFDTDGETPIAGSAFAAQLYAGPTADALEPVGPPVPFRTGAGAGYFESGLRSIPSVRAGGLASIQVRAWDTAAGATFEEAMANGGRTGTSAILSLITGNAGIPPSLPPFLLGLKSFKLQTSIPPQITRAIAPDVVTSGDRARLEAAATGSEPLIFQWYEGDPGDTRRPVGHQAAIVESEPLTATTTFWLRVSNIAGTANSAAFPVAVTRRPQEIEFELPKSVVFGAAPIPITAHASSGLPVELSVVSGHGRIEQGLLIIGGAGEIVLRASQPGDLIHLPAPEVERRLLVEKAPAMVELADLTHVFDGAPRFPEVTVEPRGLRLLLTYNGSPAPPVAPGEYAVEAIVDDVNYTGAAIGVLVIRTIPNVIATVFSDLNGDAAMDPREPGLSGVTVRLLAMDSRTELATMQTTASGVCVFEGVATGSYFLESVTPDGDFSTSPNLRLIRVTSGKATEVHFGYQPAGTLAGVVFIDANGNGLREPAENGLPEVTLRLLGNDSEWTTRTADDGTYQFAGLLPGSYTIEEIDPDGFVSTTPNFRAVSVAAGGAASAVFGDQPVETISGFVFEDLDGNGAFNEFEPGIQGVLLHLFRADDDSQAGETVTGADGLFTFSRVPAGDYIVRQAIPDGYTILAEPGSSPSPMRHGLATVDDFVEKPVRLEEDSAAAVSFANHLRGQLSGLVYSDLDGNGEPSPGEHAISGATIEVRAALDGQTVASVTTSDTGIYLVPNLPSGTYQVIQQPIDGYSTPKTTVTIQLAAGGAATANFANRPGGSVAGVVFNDENGNGVRDSAEPGLGGVQVILHRSGFPPRETLTVGDGAFLFTDVAPGALNLEQAPLAGFQPTTPAIVSVDLVAGGAASASFGNRGETVRPPVITSEPLNLALEQGATGSLMVAAEGTAPLEYQWFKDDMPLPDATTAALTLVEAAPADSGSYQVRVRNPIGTVLSRVVTVTVNPADPFDAWIAAQNLPASGRARGDDPDRDGRSNLLEFVFGTSPTDPNDNDRPIAVIADKAAGSVLGFEFRRARAAANVPVFIEASDDLVHWTIIPAEPEVFETGATADRVRLMDDVTIAGRSHRFIRLTVRP